MLSIKLLKLSEKKKYFSSFDKKIQWWKILIYVVATLVMLGLIVTSFFSDGYDWITIDQLEFDNSLYLKQIYVGVALILAGFALPIVGTCMQVTTRNKLAEPTTLGFYPMIFMTLLLSQVITSGNYYLKNYMFAFLLSCFVIGINFVILKGKPGKQTFKSILIGFAINAIATGCNYLIIEYGNVTGMDALSWLKGSFGGVTETSLFISMGLILFFLIFLFMLIPQFNIIQKDYVLAKALGIKVDLIYWVVAFCSIIITISSVFLVGGVVLMGVVVPHIVRMIFRTDNNKIVIPMSGILGMFLLSMSNWMIKAISFYGVSLNINILIAVLAIPVFILVLKGNKKRQWVTLKH